jgi:hypothetical protein
LARGRLAAGFEDLAPLVRLDGRQPLVDQLAHRVRPLDGAGLLLMPSAFLLPRLASILDTPTTPVTVCYPARGTGAIWFRSSRNQIAELPRLVGRTRAESLYAIDELMHTTALARQLGRSPGTSPIT